MVFLLSVVGYRLWVVGFGVWLVLGAVVNLFIYAR
jgi:hypothetical protein